MGLVPGIVFSVNRRALLAVLAIGVSVSYALVAGAAVSGLNEAQDALAGSLSEDNLVGVDPEMEAFDPGALEPEPDLALARATVSDETVYTVRVGPPAVDNASRALVGRTSSWSTGDTIRLDGRNFTAEAGTVPKGAGSRWIGLAEPNFTALGGAKPPGAHVVVYEEASEGLANALESQGLAVRQAPATFSFYTAGAQQLVSGVSVTVVASAFVVGLLTTTVVSMELRAKRSTFATLQVYAGSGLVRRLVASRGMVVLAAGHLVGLATTFGLLFMLERGGAARLALPEGYLATAVGATLGGGLLGLAIPVWRAGTRVDASQLGTDEPPPDLPAPLRLTLCSWRTVVPLAISAAVLAGSLGVVYGAVDMPGQLFGTDDARVIAETSDNPLRGKAPSFLGKHLGAMEGFTGSSPEIYAPTVVDGRPVMVRGVHWPSLRSMNRVDLVEGRPPSAPGEAVLGNRLANLLDADPGHRFVLPSPYDAAVERVEVVGVAKAPGLLDDEVLLHLGTAREFAGLPPGTVNLVRYRVDAEFRSNQTRDPAFPSGLEVTDLTLEPDSPIPFQQARANLDLVNFRSTSASRHLTLRVNGEPLGDTWVDVDGHSTASASIPFRVPSAGLLTVQVNPTRQVQTGDPAYRIDAPNVATNGTEIEVGVLHAGSDEPAEGIDLRLKGQAATTDAGGTASLRAEPVGNWTITAEGPDGRGAAPLLVVDPADLYRGRVLFQSISGPREISGNSWSGAGQVVNAGGETFDGMAKIEVDGELRNTTQIRLEPGTSGRVAFELELGPGEHRIGRGEAAISVTVLGEDGGTGGGGTGTDGDGDADGGDGGADDGSSGAGDDDAGDGGGGGGPATGEERIRELLRQRAGSQGGGDDGETEPIQAFLADTFENFNAAVTVVVIATVLHAGLIGVVVVRRDVEENAGTLGTLASAGADRADLRKRALLEFSIVGAVAATLGTAVGLGAVAWAAHLGWIGGFGHALVPRTGLGFALRVGAVSIGVTLAATVLAVEQVRGRRLRSLMVEGPVRSRRPPLDRLIGGET